MKKLVYIFVLLASIAMSVASCTEEVVKPKDGAADGSSTSVPKGS